MMNINNVKAGRLFSVEGIDGTGKSTQISKIIHWFRQRGFEVNCYREPGGVRTSEKIRDLLLDTENSICKESELLLYTASRIQLIKEKILPDINAGKIVLMDRFADSTTAYQGWARGLDLYTVSALNNIVKELIWPERTWWLDLDPEIAFGRLGDTKDRLEAEGLEFFKRVHHGYMQIQANEPSRVLQIDASGSVDQVFEKIEIDLRNTIAYQKDSK
jgi:dTMP kinase